MSDKQRMTNPDVPGAEIFASPRTQPSREAAGWVLDSAGEQPAAATPVVETEKAPRAPKES